MAVTSLPNNELKVLASKYERTSINNNIFNKKNISDHKTISNLYSSKSNPKAKT